MRNYSGQGSIFSSIFLGLGVYVFKQGCDAKPFCLIARGNFGTSFRTLVQMAVKKTKRNRTSSVQVAKLAGVSQATVSRVFTVGARVSTERRSRVLSAAKKLGYRPNVLARSLTRQ